MKSSCVSPRLRPLVGEEGLVSPTARSSRAPPAAPSAPLGPAGASGAWPTLLLLDREALLLLLDSSAKFLPRDAVAAVELENPAGHVVQEVAVVRDGHDGARIFREMALEPRDGLGVQMIGGLVQEEQVRPLEENLAERHPPTLAARDLRDVRVAGREAQRVHRDLELVVELPGVGGLDRVLHPLVLGHQLLALYRREVLGHLFVQLVEALQERSRLRDRLFDVAEHVLGGIQPRVLRKKAHRGSIGREGFAREVLLDAGHDLQHRRLAGAVQPALDLRPGRTTARSPQDLPLRRNDLGRF
jgi:hypothetical protein